MSRKIDFSQPLSEEDEAYLADRPWLRIDAEMSGFDLSEETDFAVDDGDDPDEDPEGFEDGDDQSDDEDDEESDEDGGSDEVAPYSEWDYADLKTEAGERGLSKSGSKEQLIERLEAHDASAE